MSLTSALSIAQSALFNTSRQTSVVSRNVSEASNPDYSRRSAVLTGTAPGAQVAEIRRATDAVLFRQNMQAIASWQGQDAVSKGLDTLRVSINGVDNANAPSTALGELQQALQLYAATPSNATLAQSAVEAAREMAHGLNRASTAIQSFRRDADQRIAASVDKLNSLLADFENANNEIVTGTRVDRDVSDALDRRDALLKQIAEHVPVSTVTRPGNDMVLTTTDGAVLFETVPRPVTFEPTSVFSAGANGNAVHVDGVALRPGSGGNTTASGSIAAELQLRDDVAPAMQRQLDEVARGLITAFAETDPSGGAPDAAGLFTWSGGPAIPAGGTLVDGLAAQIGVNPAMDPGAGGNPVLLRDGGANGAAYIHNGPPAAASYSELLRAYGEKLDAPMSFDPAAGLDATTSLGAYASDAIGWLENLRQDAARGNEAKEALSTRTSTALSDATGVNVDEEMSLLLDLEHSYQASARMIRTIDDMLSQLLAATG